MFKYRHLVNSSHIQNKIHREKEGIHINSVISKI